MHRFFLHRLQLSRLDSRFSVRSGFTDTPVASFITSRLIGTQHATGLMVKVAALLPSKDLLSSHNQLSWTHFIFSMGIQFKVGLFQIPEPANVGNYIFLSSRFTQMGTGNDSAIFYLQRLLQYDSECGQAFMKLGNMYNWGKDNSYSAKFYYRKSVDHYNTIKPGDNRMMAGYSLFALHSSHFHRFYPALEGFLSLY